MQDYVDLHRFEVLKKGYAKKPVVFHALGDMDVRAKQRVDDNASTSYSTSDEQFYSKIISMCLGAECDPHRLKNHNDIPPFEATLNLQKRRALYTRVKIHNNQKGLGY